MVVSVANLWGYTDHGRGAAEKSIRELEILEGALDSTLSREVSARKQTKIMAYQILMILKVAPYSGLDC